MVDGNCCLSPDDIRKVYDELDLHEKGITQEEITRRKTRIFVGGLKFASEDHVLHDYFATFGKIKEAVVIRDRKTGLSKGYGFVTMVEDLPALKAILDKSPKLDGRRCNVNLAYIGQKNKPQAKKPRDARQYPFGTPVCGYPNGIMVSPPVVMTTDGRYCPYTGTSPQPYPIYHVISDTPPPPPYDARGDVYPPPPPPPPHAGMGAAAGSWQNPIVLPQPIIIDNPVTPGNNNNNNIYLTNNIYYKTIENIEGGPPPDFKQIDEKGISSSSKELIAAAGPHHPPPLGQPLHLLTQGLPPLGPHILPMPCAFPFSHPMDGPMNYFNGEGDGLLNISMSKFDPGMAGFPTETTLTSPTKTMKITDIREEKNVA